MDAIKKHLQMALWPYSGKSIDESRVRDCCLFLGEVQRMHGRHYSSMAIFRVRGAAESTAGAFTHA
eukprot:scaffold18382_cov14-Tisochrysis_lutea.AAC.1